MIKRAAAIIILPLLLMTMTGCWGKKELNEIGIVTATGVDLEPDGQIRITVLSQQPEGSLSNPVTRSSTWIGTAVGPNLTEASRNLRAIATKSLSWLQNSLIIIGSETAKSRMNEVVDFFSRNRELRFNSYILVADGRAFDLLEAPSDIQRDLLTEILGMIRNVDEWSKTLVSTAKDLLVSISDECGNMVTGRIAYENTSRNTFSTAREDYEKLDLKDRPLPLVFLSGCAVFKKNRMVGWLDADQTLGFLWITNKRKPGSVVSIKADGGTLTMENKFADSKVSIKKEGESIQAKIKIDTIGNLMEQTTKQNLQDENTMKQIEDSFSQAITDEMKQVIKKTQMEYKVDIFGFDRLLSEKYPAEWKKIKKNWSEIFPMVKVEYDVTVTIEKTGKILRAVF